MIWATLLVVCLSVAHISSRSSDPKSGIEINKLLSQWSLHKVAYQLNFEGREDDRRFGIFANNQRRILETNSKNLGFTLAMNQFSHMTHEEYKTYVKSGGVSVKVTAPVYVPSSTDLPDVDWRLKGAVSGIKDQGQCGSCWAFSTIGCLEGQYALKTGEIVTLSEQDLVDCSKSYGNDGCQGGLMDYGFDYVKDFGIDSEAKYPYTATDNKCVHKNKTSVLKVTSYEDVTAGDEDQLSEVVSTYGPVSIAFDASDYSFQFYSSGIYKSDYCSPEDLDHGMLLVGIGSSPSPYYIIKNSWGVSWGQQGYMFTARNANNMCGIASAASYAQIKI